MSSLLARSVALMVIVLTLAGCGVALEKSRVERRFEAIHGCPAASVRATGGDGYVVEGCNVRAHYVCTGHDTRNPLMEELLFGSPHCIQDDVQRVPGAPPPPAPPPVRVVEHEAGYPVLVASVPLEAARLHVLGAPTREPAHAYLNLEWRRAVDASDECSERLWVDGVEVELASTSLEEVGRGLRFRARFDAAWLGRMAAATRITGVLCGESFVLPVDAAAVLREADIRFRELATAGADVDAVAAAGR